MSDSLRMEEADAMISEAVLDARSVAVDDLTSAAKALSEMASDCKKLFRLLLTDVESSMKIKRMETGKLAKLTFDQSWFGRRVDSLLTMATSRQEIWRWLRRRWLCCKELQNLRRRKRTRPMTNWTPKSRKQRKT